MTTDVRAHDTTPLAPGALRADAPQLWREAVLRRSFAASIGIAGIAAAAYVFLQRAPRFDWLAGVLVAATVVAAALRFLPRLPYVVRAGAGVLVLYVAGTASLLRVGPTVGPTLALACAVLVAATLLGGRCAAGCLALTTGTILILGLLGALGLVGGFRLPESDFTSATVAIRITLSFTLLTGLAVVIVTHLMRQAEESLARATEALARLRRAEWEREQAEAERQRAEAALREAQKLEAVGRLAGGVAHDFNNSLMVILAWADSLRATPHADPADAEAAEQIHRAATHAAGLTRRLMAFARRDVPKPTRVDLDRLVEETTGALRRLLAEDVSIAFRPGGVPPVRADEGQVGQILLALAANAGEAMPNGGRLELATRVVLPPNVPPTAADRTRAYVEIAVRDTGIGMDEATRARLFEPFFTTKAKGARGAKGPRTPQGSAEGRRGVGLGLATAYGLVASVGGYITVESAPGVGSTFTVAFPVAAEEPLPEPAAPVPRARSLAGRTILVAEDDEAVRKVIVTGLRGAGHAVLEAPSADEALAIARGHGGAIDLLCTDAVMPGLPAAALIEEFERLFPGAPVLVCSGHVDEEVLRRGVARGAYRLLQKPIAAAALVAEVDRALGEARAGRA
jgi:signal transduction histidine kinase